MPYLRIQTNQTVLPEERDTLLAEASRTAAEMLGKPERYVMVALRDGVPMVFAGSDAPCVYLELKSIGLPDERTAELSASLCELMERQLQVSRERVYIEFASAERHLWGWNGATF